MTEHIKETELTDEVDVPRSINLGLTVADPNFMLSLLGRPRATLTQNHLPITNKALAALIVTVNVGPFTTTGLRPAVESLTKVMADIAKEQHEVYAALGTSGMLVVRNMRPNRKTPDAPPKISNHAWGTAIDLLIDNKLDPYNNGKTFFGLTLIAPIFNRHGWYWGGRYRTSEDAMHFEVSKEKLQEWQNVGLFGPTSKHHSSHHRAIFDLLKRGDRGPKVVALQDALNARNYNLPSDGIFGKKTEWALTDFQRKHDLIPHGTVSVKTALYLALL